MPLGQGWLNAWVKVNSKHVVFPSSQTSTASPVSNHRIDSTSEHEPHSYAGHEQHDVACRDVTADLPLLGTSPSGSIGNLSLVRRQHSRRKQRRQQRRSLTDGSKRKGKNKDRPTVDASARSVVRSNSSTSVGRKHKSLSFSSRDESSCYADADRTGIASVHNSSQAMQPPNRNQERDADADADEEPIGDQQVEDFENETNAEPDHARDDGDKDTPLRFVTGFFGANFDAHEQNGAQQQRYSQSDRCHRNDERESRSVQILHDRRRSDTDSLLSHGGHSAPPRTQTRYVHDHHAKTKKSESAKPQGGIMLRFPFVDHNAGCSKCKKLEEELTTCRSDLEYARVSALQYEAQLSNAAAVPVPVAQEASKSNEMQTGGNATNNPSLLEVSRRMTDILTQHRQEMEALTIEKIQWQQEYNAKHQKLTTFCKELDEEATMRNEEAIALHQQLDDVRLERDALATEMQRLQFDADQLQAFREENIQLRARLEFYEQHGIEGADESIRRRDAIIEQLIHRLRKAMRTIRTERDQYTQRRQIIFPSISRSSNNNGADDETNDLRKAKASLQAAEDTIERMKLEHARKELEWIRKMECLSRQNEEQIIWTETERSGQTIL